MLRLNESRTPAGNVRGANGGTVEGADGRVRGPGGRIKGAGLGSWLGALTRLGRGELGSRLWSSRC